MTPAPARQGTIQRIELPVNGGQLRRLLAYCQEHSISRRQAAAEMLEDYLSKREEVPLPGMRIGMDE